MYACWEVRQLLAESRWFPPGPPVSSANKTDRHGMTLDVEGGVKHQSIKFNSSLQLHLHVPCVMFKCLF